MKKVLHFIRVFMGVVCALCAFIYVVLIFTEQELRGVFAFLAVVFGVLAFLLLRHKKEKPPVLEPVEVERPVDAYIEADGAVYRTDGQPISDREVPYLIETGFQEALRREQNNPLRRSTAEQDLIFRFIETHEKHSSALTSQFETLRAAAFNTNSLDEKIILLTDALQKYEIAKEWHYKNSKGGMMYFQDMWERMHNSQNACFSWADMTADDLQDLTCERDYIRPGILSKATNGFLQKDIYAQLPKANKYAVQRIIKEMESEGAICRVKSGNSYFVTLA